MSSPEPPPLAELVKKHRRPQLQTGSRAATIPEDAIRGFSKASDIFRATTTFAAQEDLPEIGYILANKACGEDEIWHVEGGRSRADSTGLNKRGATKSNVNHTRKSGVRKSKEYVEDSQDEGLDSVATEPLKRRKSRKSLSTGQSRISKGRIKKASMTDEGGKDASKVVPEVQEVVHATATGATFEQSLELDSVNNSFGKATELMTPLGLEKASVRRRDWTPVKDTGNVWIDISLDPEQPSPIERRQSSNTPPCARETFQSVASNFTFQQGKDAATKSKDSKPPTTNTTKRRKIDFNDASAIRNTDGRSRSPQKVSIVKKKAQKPQTITNKATRQFVVPEIEPPSSSILTYFDRTLEEDNSPSNEPARDKQDGKSVKTISKRKPKKASVLSPENAIQALNNQDLSFGTSSQLVREDSPEFQFNRDLQEALQISAAGLSCQDNSGDHRPNWKHSKARQASSSLWPAAARDSQGSLMEADVIDLTESPRFSIGGLYPTPVLLQPVTSTANAEAALDRLIEEDRLSSHQGAEETRELPRSLAEASLLARPRSRSPVKKTGGRRKASPSKKSSPTKTREFPIVNGSQMPDFSQQPIEELKKQVAAYGFKAVRSKKNNVALLEKCWRSKHGLSQPTVPSCPADVPELPTSASTKATSPAKPRGRPKKDVPAKHNGSDRLDCTAMPLESLPPPSSQIQKDVHTCDNLDATSALHHQTTSAPVVLLGSRSSAETDNERLLNSITTAIKTYPPTHDPKKPTWAEKMALYDPIVLEDLTVWLNTVGLGKVGCDEEVWPALVREWCESKSVCCLWRINLRGGERARY